MTNKPVKSLTNLTARKRAKKIYYTMPSEEFGSKEEYVNLFTAEIEQAEREAREEGRKEIRDACTQHQHAQYADGYKAGAERMREECALAANQFDSEDGGSDEVMEYAIKAEKRIRALPLPSATVPGEGKEI